jgi:hypothetical protein
VDRSCRTTIHQRATSRITRRIRRRLAAVSSREQEERPWQPQSERSQRPFCRSEVLLRRQWSWKARFVRVTLEVRVLYQHRRWGEDFRIGTVHQTLPYSSGLAVIMLYSYFRPSSRRRNHSLGIQLLRNLGGKQKQAPSDHDDTTKYLSREVVSVPGIYKLATYRWTT